MKLNYPNQFDLKWAKHEGRKSPGTNIFIHGKAVSIGCLAMGDKSIEELFVLSKLVGLKNVRVIISPSDPLLTPLENTDSSRPWIDTLYLDIEQALSDVRGSH
jgi:murein L,D-transpeptidase YafK